MDVTVNYKDCKTLFFQVSREFFDYGTAIVSKPSLQSIRGMSI